MKLHEKSMITHEEGEIISGVLSKLPEKGRLLELGTGYGHSAVHFAKLKPRWTIYTVDGYGMYGDIQNIFKVGENNFKADGFLATYNYIKDNGATNVVPIVGNTATLSWDVPVNVIFIDADHSYEWVKKDTEHYLKFVRKGGLIIYHDYNSNWDVQKYFDTEMVGRKGWDTWSREALAFAKKL